MTTFHCRHVFSAALIATLTLSQTGCSSSHSSPQAVFSSAKSAIKSKNYSKFFSLVDPDTQASMAGTMAMMASTMKTTMSRFTALAGGDESKVADELEKIDKVLEKHGVSSEQISGKSPGDVAALIKNKPAFIGDMIKVMESAQKAAGTEANEPPDLGELSNVEIDGDSATGTMTSDDRDTTITFKKIDGKWYMSNGFFQKSAGTR